MVYSFNDWAPEGGRSGAFGGRSEAGGGRSGAKRRFFLTKTKESPARFRPWNRNGDGQGLRRFSYGFKNFTDILQNMSNNINLLK
jgi:hypothetical protein